MILAILKLNLTRDKRGEERFELSSPCGQWILPAPHQFYIKLNNAQIINRRRYHDTSPYTYHENRITIGAGSPCAPRTKFCRKCRGRDLNSQVLADNGF